MPQVTVLVSEPLVPTTSNSCNASRLPSSTWSVLQTFSARIDALIARDPQRADAFIRWMHWILKSYEG